MSTYLLDTTVLIAHLRGDAATRLYLLFLLDEGLDLATSCVNVAEIERGLRPAERRAASALLQRLHFLPTSREASERAGAYQASFGRVGRTLSTADALIAGTARVHGAILVTDNVKDFPMSDVRKTSGPRPPPQP